MTDVLDPSLALICYFSFTDTRSLQDVSLMCNFKLLVAQQFSLQQISMKYSKNHYVNIPKLQGKVFHICNCSKMV